MSKEVTIKLVKQWTIFELFFLVNLVDSVRFKIVEDLTV